MKIILDIDYEKEKCGKCSHLINNLSVQGFSFGIPIEPTCFVFLKQVLYRHEKRNAMRLPECIKAGVSIPNIPLEAKVESAV
jgi:hypothetical protein